MPLSVGSPRVVRYVVGGDQWWPLRTGGQKGELMEWARILAYISGTVDQELLLRNEYLAAENQILRGQLKGRPKLSDAERAKLGEIGRRLGRKALGDVATAALPDTILDGTEGASRASSMARSIEAQVDPGSRGQLRN